MAGNAISNREGNIIQLYGIIIPVKKRYFPAKKNNDNGRAQFSVDQLCLLTCFSFVRRFFSTEVLPNSPAMCNDNNVFLTERKFQLYLETFFLCTMCSLHEEMFSKVSL